MQENECNLASLHDTHDEQVTSYPSTGQEQAKQQKIKTQKMNPNAPPSTAIGTGTTTNGSASPVVRNADHLGPKRVVRGGFEDEAADGNESYFTATSASAIMTAMASSSIAPSMERTSSSTSTRQSQPSTSSFQSITSRIRAAPNTSSNLPPPIAEDGVSAAAAAILMNDGMGSMHLASFPPSQQPEAHTRLYQQHQFTYQQHHYPPTGAPIPTTNVGSVMQAFQISPSSRSMSFEDKLFLESSYPHPPTGASHLKRHPGAASKGWMGGVGGSTGGFSDIYDSEQSSLSESVDPVAPPRLPPFDRRAETHPTGVNKSVSEDRFSSQAAPSTPSGPGKGGQKHASVDSISFKKKELPGQATRPQNGDRKPQREMTKAERRELQERQRADKAARIASGAGGGNTKPKGQSNADRGNAANQGGGGDVGGGGGSGGSTNVVPRVSHEVRFDDPTKNSKNRQKVQKAHALHKKLAQKPVPLFSHLMQFEKENNVRAELKAQGIIHPSILSLGLQFSENMITGGNARCMAMMLAFKKVVFDYSTPSGTSLQRHLTSFISKQVDFLNNSRSLAASMKTAIRYLKLKISNLSIDIPDQDAKEQICRNIDEFIQNRIQLPGLEIIKKTLSENRLTNGDVILTYGKSSLVEQLLIAAHEARRSFRVIIVDARPMYEGKELLRRLVAAGIKCAYITINAIPFIIKEVTKVFIGASAVLSNGAVMSRVGTAVVAMMSRSARVPVICFCETYKFSEIVRLDSFVWNEIGNPEELVNCSTTSPSERVPSVIPPSLNERRAYFKAGALKDWREIDSLKLLNLHYDVTPSEYITMVMCELGPIPSSTVLSVIKDITIS